MHCGEYGAYLDAMGAQPPHLQPPALRPPHPIPPPNPTLTIPTLTIPSLTLPTPHPPPLTPTPHHSSGDKAFGVTALVALALQPGVVSTLPFWFLAICALKLPLHAALAVTRTQDYRAKLAGKTNGVALPAVGCGKLATCSENFGCAVASLALATDCAPAVTVVAGLLGVLSLDMACRSLSHKLRARC